MHKGRIQKQKCRKSIEFTENIEKFRIYRKCRKGLEFTENVEKVKNLQKT